MPGALIKSPLPFPIYEATTEVVVIQEIDTEDQGPQEIEVYSGMAVFDRSSQHTFNADSKLTALSGTIIIQGDVQTIGNLTAIQGYVKIYDDEQRAIFRVSKPTAMGVVFSTEIELV